MKWFDKLYGWNRCATLAGVVVFLGSHIPRLLPTSLGFTSCAKPNKHAASECGMNSFYLFILSCFIHTKRSQYQEPLPV